MMSSMLVRRQVLQSRALHRWALQSRYRFHSGSKAKAREPLLKGSNSSKASNKVLAYGAGGTVLAASFAFLLTGRRGSDIEDDARDRRALSGVPLTKLISGWV